MSSDENENDSPAPEESEAPRPHGPLHIVLPTDLLVWGEARRLVGDKKVRVEDLSTTISQDPVIVLELLKIANAMYFSGGRPPISSTKTAIVRLGSEMVIETLEKMKERQPLPEEDAQTWLEVHRNRCKRTSIVARIFAEALAKQLSDDCQAAGVLMNIGDMIAVAHFGQVYADLAEQHSRSGINHRLATDHKFDSESIGVSYLKRQGIPETLVFAIERDGRPRSPDRAVMKPICQASNEMVEAFDSNKWEKLAPGKKLAPKSALRLLQMSDIQYLKLYERVSEFLFSIRLLDERKKQDELKRQQQEAEPELIDVAPETLNDLDAEIQNLISGDGLDDETVAEDTGEEGFDPEPTAKDRSETDIVNLDEDLIEERFSLSSSRAKTRDVPRVQKAAKPTQLPELRTSKGTKTVASITTMFNEAENSEELLTSLLDMLVGKGPFEKSALIVIAKDRKTAIVVAARGPNIGNGQTLELTDPLSPLAQCFSKVQSWGNKESKESPFGSKAFALAPIDADHDTPVALYADCGKDGSITFEARRIFRTVVGILNQKLPHLPGGIPVELHTGK